MDDFWARRIDASGRPGAQYWNYFAGRLAQLADVPRGASVLDVGTADGNVLFEAMQKMDAQGYGIGIDLDRRDFSVGVAESVRRGWQEKVAFSQMDADALGFRPGTFHAVLANFVGWDDFFDFTRKEFIHPDRRTPGIMRVLKPGGQVGITTWIEQSDMDWLAETYKKYLPEYNQDISCYGKEDPEGYRRILHSSGFEDVRVTVETDTFASPDAETWWQQMRRAASRYFKQVTDPLRLEEFKQHVYADLGEFHRPEGICFNKTVAYALGRKPA